MTERRFELFRKHVIKDNGENTYPIIFDAGIACITLNEQDQKIKELKEEIKGYKYLMAKYNVEDLEHLDLMLVCLSGQTKYHLAEIKEKHKKELKQSQNSKAIEVLKQAKIEFETYYADNIWNYPKWIDNQIKELGEGEK